MHQLLIVAAVVITMSACGGRGGDDDWADASSNQPSSSMINGAPVNSYTCSSFRYQEDAQANYSSQLDADHDGIACESLPHR